MPLHVVSRSLDRDTAPTEGLLRVNLAPFHASLFRSDRWIPARRRRDARTARLRAASVARRAAQAADRRALTREDRRAAFHAATVVVRPGAAVLPGRGGPAGSGSAAVATCLGNPEQAKIRAHAQPAAARGSAERRNLGPQVEADVALSKDRRNPEASAVGSDGRRLSPLRRGKLHVGESLGSAAAVARYRDWECVPQDDHQAASGFVDGPAVDRAALDVRFPRQGEHGRSERHPLLDLRAPSHDHDLSRRRRLAAR
jgi:hypothetical protein